MRCRAGSSLRPTTSTGCSARPARSNGASSTRCRSGACRLEPMAPPLPVAVIVNPAAHKGGAGKRWSAIEAELSARLGPFKPHFTRAPGHATELARAALAEGARRIVAVGGDGTVNEVLNG